MSVDIYEAKPVAEDDSAEKATMDMIKEELNKEMGDDTGGDGQ